MVHFAFVLHLHQSNKKQAVNKSCRRRKPSKGATLLCDNVVPVHINEKPTFDTRKIDNIAFNVVGSAFVLFNILYWTIFMTVNFDYGDNSYFQ